MPNKQKTPKQPDPAPIFVRVSACQPRFGIHRATIYRAAKRGEIKIHKRGAMSLLDVAEVSAWIKGSKEMVGG